MRHRQSATTIYFYNTWLLGKVVNKAQWMDVAGKEASM